MRRSFWCFAVCALVSAVGADGQVVRGIVRDSTGKGLEGASVVIPRHQLGAGTNDDGRYILSRVPSGTVTLVARRIGFQRESLTVKIGEHDTVTANFTLMAAPLLMHADSVYGFSTTGKMGPFNQRRARGVGSFITREEIDKRQPASISELLRYLPGIAITQMMAGEPQPVRMQRSMNTTTIGNCVVQIYVDGHPYPNGNVDDFSPMSVEGIEVYKSAAEIPAAFRTKDATCGVIAIWTRDPETRKP